MLKTLSLSISFLAASTVSAFAHTGVGEAGHDLKHVVMNHDGSMSIGLTLAALTGVVVVGLVAYRRRNKV